MDNTIVLSRKAAFKIAWKLFWLATGTRRVGLTVTKNTIEMVGNDLVGESDE